MASCFFLLRQFEDVLIYLNSVKVSDVQYKAHIMLHIQWKTHTCYFTVISVCKVDSHTLGEKCHLRWQVVLYRCSCMFVCFSLWFVVPTKSWYLLCSLFRDTWALTVFVCGQNCSFFPQGYFYNDDTFNFNYAQAKAALGNYKEAEEVPYFSLHLQILLTNVDNHCVALIVMFPYRFFYSFRVRRSRMTMFISAGWHDAVCIVVQFVVICRMWHGTYKTLSTMKDERNWRKNVDVNILIQRLSSY